MGVDSGAVAAVDGMGVGADAAVMTIDGGIVGVVAGMEVELDVEVDSTAPGWTAAHNGQNQSHCNCSGIPPMYSHSPPDRTIHCCHRRS